MTDTIDAAGIVAAITRPLEFRQSAHRPCDEVAHGIGAMYALAQDDDCVIASMIESSGQTKTICDDMQQARAWANGKERARIAAALDVGPILALAEALDHCLGTITGGMDGTWDHCAPRPADMARAALTAFKEASHG